MVDLARMFLGNRRGELTEALHVRIQLASDALDFETAAYWRDILDDCNKLWSNSRWNVWLDKDVVDTFAIDDEAPDLRIYLVTQRKRHVLGRKVFSFSYPTTLDEAMREILDGFYQFYAPREIRITQDFENRRKLSCELSQRFSRPISISVITNSTQRATTIRAARLARDEIELDTVKPHDSPSSMANELRDFFGLEVSPKRIECFDVAHISGRGFASAWSTWIDGHFVGGEYGFRISKEKSELACLADAVEFRLSQADPPDLIVLDGGKPQLNAVLEKVALQKSRRPGIVAATKPQGKHSGVAYFLLESGERIDFDEMNASHNLLKLLRDDAHDLANRVHRDLRDSSHNYELAAVLPSLNEAERRKVLKTVGSISKLTGMFNDQVSKLFDSKLAKRIIWDLEKFRTSGPAEIVPLIVPIRFDAENGSADDLRPIKTR
jgi:excinuclease ABC subunit C